MGGVKLVGQDSRNQPQKSMAIYLREIYGLSEITYPFFETGDANTFKSFVLRNSGEDPNRIRIKDTFLSYALKGQMDIDMQDYRAVVVYINGKYYGLYNLREKVNENYLVSNYGIEKGSVDLIKGINTVQAGSIDQYNSLLNYIRTHDTRNDDVYAYLETQIDMQELCNYWVVQTYYANTDTGNIRFWKEKNGGKWRWILFDQDWSMYPTTYQSTDIFYPFLPYGHGTGNYFPTTITYKLWQNSKFRDLYLTTLAYHLKNTFKPSRMQNILEKLKKEVESEMPYHIERWYSEYKNSGDGAITSMDSWNNNVNKLSNMLEKYYNQKVYVLLDEYDAPILSSYLNGFYVKCINFMRDLFSATFKGNLSMKKGIITGILRVSKEDMFSGANNIKVYNITDYNYSNHFGFTEEEVKDVLNQYDLSGNFNKIKKWYDGYRFSDYVVYNPWSILNYLSDRKHTLQAYWVNTGGVDLLRKLIYSKRNTGLLEEYHKLLETNEVCNVNLDMYMDLKSLDNSRDTIWTLFMLAGYLTPKGNVINTKNITLRIPNLEIRENLENICVKWFNDNISYRDLLEEDLVNNNMNEFKKTFTDIVNESFSYYDVERRYGENFYHAFCMGLLYSYNYHFKITSNRESGYGRYDLLLKPINKSCNNAYIIEFKSIENDNFDETIEKAFNQIEGKKYDIELKEEGYHINKIVIVFKYKEIKMEIR